MPTIKIALCGSQGSGKTTEAYELATELKKMGKDVYVLSEVARSCPLPINEGVLLESQYWIIGKQLTREQSCKAEILVSDRSLLDPFVYGMRKFPEDFANLFPFVEAYMKTYDYIIYLPANDEYLKEDGLRSTNKEFRDEIDILMKEFVKSFNLKLYTTKEVLADLKGE